MAHVQLAIAGHTLKNAGLEKNKKREMGEKIEKLRCKILGIQQKFSSKADDALKLAQKELEKGDVENRTEERIAETAGILSETKHWADSTSEPSLDTLVMQTNIEIPAGAIVSQSPEGIFDAEEKFLFDAEEQKDYERCGREPEHGSQSVGFV